MSKEKVHPTTQQTTSTTITAVATTTIPTRKLSKYPPNNTKQLPITTPYRPRPPPTHRGNHYRHHQRRQCCTCKCFLLTLFWMTIITISTLILAFTAATIFYVVYHPQPPSFSLTSLKIAQFNLTSPTQFTNFIKLNLSITTKNPNNKITFYYKTINLKLLAHKGSIKIGQTSFPAFYNPSRTTTILSTTIVNNNDIIDDASFGILKNDMNRKNRGFLDLKVNVETEMKVRIGNKVETDYVGLRVNCDGIKVHARTNYGKVGADIVDVKCSIHLFVKLFDWDVQILDFGSQV